MENYDSNELIDYLNNPIKKGLWSLSATVDDEEEINTLIEKKNPFFKDYIPILSFRFIQWFGDMVILSSKLDDGEERLLKSYGLLADQERYALRGFRSHSLIGRRFLRKKPMPRKKSESIKNDFKKEIEIIKTSFPKIINVVGGDDLDFISIEPTCHFSFSEDFNQIKALSFDKEALENLKKLIEVFFEDIPAKIDINIKKVYTPELLVYRPYFHLLFLLIQNKRITENQKVMREFQLSFSEAFDLKPEGSIRSSGLAMELLLEEIYESLFRDKAPSKTLGNLFNILNGKVNEIIDGDNNNSTDEKCEDIFKDINCIIKQESNPNLLKVIEISRIILHKTKEMEKKINIVDKKFQLKQEKSSLLFSESITENINKTIELRNLSSHRTMNELTTFQAALALRGTFNLLSWWNYQNTSFSDWDKSIEEVVKSVVKQSENFKL